MIEAGKPIFVQIAEQIENDIVDGVLEEEISVPSTNEFAAFHRINPARADKGVNRLVEDGILCKRRGIGMFVATGARQRLVVARTEQFRANFVGPLLSEAAKLGITPEQAGHLLRISARARFRRHPPGLLPRNSAAVRTDLGRQRPRVRPADPARTADRGVVHRHLYVQRALARHRRVLG
ncbi:GntR family transcriptional regulator [Cryobacterium sp. Hh38]|nr:GntR family transcriptional regulator [Cryobacterium sp. Hh38]